MYALRTPRHDGGNEVAGGLTATMRAVTSQGFIQFHPSLAERLGFKAALFLGHALYWSRHLAKTQPKRNGWFFMTARQWQQATGLTTREQTSVRELLVDQQLLVERVAGKPARMHFRVDLTRLAHWAGLHADEDGTSLMTWEQFSPWMRGCVSFYRPLVDVAGGSVAAALYLSYLLHAQRFSTQIAGAEDGFFPVSQEDVRIALCLGPKTQRNAREKLRQLGLLHERYGLARIDLDALGQALGQPKGISEAPQARRAASVPSDMATVVTRYQASPGTGVRRRRGGHGGSRGRHHAQHLADFDQVGVFQAVPAPDLAPGLVHLGGDLHDRVARAHGVKARLAGVFGAGQRGRIDRADARGRAA